SSSMMTVERSTWSAPRENVRCGVESGARFSDGDCREGAVRRDSTARRLSCVFCAFGIDAHRLSDRFSGSRFRAGVYLCRDRVYRRRIHAWVRSLPAASESACCSLWKPTSFDRCDRPDERWRTLALPVQQLCGLDSVALHDGCRRGRGFAFEHSSTDEGY